MFNRKSEAAYHRTSASALALHNVTVRYGNVRALEDFTLDVKQSEQIAIVGPNGAGKSTLFKVITGLVRPSTGRVDVYGSRPNEHICIGYVPQSSQIDWRFPVTVFDVVMMGRVGKIGLFRWAGQQDRVSVMSALQAVDMLHLAKRQIGELSGGQQQRVFLARALAQEAHILLLDEPLSGLDMPSQEAILKILADLQTRNMTMLVAIHDLGQAAESFHQVLLLNRRIIARGVPKEVFTHSNLVEAYGGRFQMMPFINDERENGLHRHQSGMIDETKADIKDSVSQSV
ncbi:metal ABC transporter ATP-binding protein [Chloroflexi bacterium TSY]|nr:metal ABC transporter ATP-binding protein [Chloroflexi bacterium TSY]